MVENPPILGPGWDFAVFWSVGRAILEGGDPYAVVGSLYPPATLYAFSVFALVPERIAYGLFLIVNIVLLVDLVSPRRAIHWLAFMPVMFIFAAGQLDLLLLYLAAKVRDAPQTEWRAPILAALVTLKPQLAIVLLPWFVIRWLRDAYRGSKHSSIVIFVLATVLIHGFPILLEPRLYRIWFERTNAGITEWAPVTPGLFSLVEIGVPWLLLAVLAAGLGLLGWLSGDSRFSWTTGLAALPVGHIYGTVVLIRAAPWWLLAPLSWLMLLLAHRVGAYVPISAITLIALAWRLRKVAREGELLSFPLRDGEGWADAQP